MPSLKNKYLMENADEIHRLEIKTEQHPLETIALWAGLKPGMRVADLGCGSGKTTSFLKNLVGEKGEVVGVDSSLERISYARGNYGQEGISFVCDDFSSVNAELGFFDFIWCRFILEYYRKESFALVRHFTKLLSGSGVLCLVDLDHNSLSHYDLSKKLEKAIFGAAKWLEKKVNFDPYAGRKLYSYLYDLSYRDIDVRLDAHHLIFGKLNSVDEFNWLTKIAVAGKESGYPFNEFEGGFEEFYSECKKYFHDPRRFTYTPMISCRGVKGGHDIL